MRLTKTELATKLNVSERALTRWQDEGMPVLEHGRRGEVNCYDLVAVLKWIRRTRDPRYTPDIPLEQLEKECGLAEVQTSAQQQPAAPAPAALSRDDDEALRFQPALELALLTLPAILARTGVADAAIDRVLDEVLTAARLELQARGEPSRFIARELEGFRRMLEEERAHPGSWTK
jgi:hypothetical protein